MMVPNCPFVVVLLVLPLGVAVTIEESCAVAGNCIESLDLEPDGGLALIQKKARAHHVVQVHAKSRQSPGDNVTNTGGKITCVGDAKFATNAAIAKIAEYTENADEATNADDSEQADNAENTDAAKYAKKAMWAKYAIYASDAVHICGDTYTDGEPQVCQEMRSTYADVGTNAAPNSTSGTSGNNSSGAEVCEDTGNTTAMQCAGYALCAEKAIDAKYAKYAKYSLQAVNARNAKEAVFAENAEMATHVETAQWSEYALYAKETVQQRPTEFVQKAEHRPLQLFEKWHARFVKRSKK